MRSESRGAAAWGIAFMYGDTAEGVTRLEAWACKRCGDLCCDGYPCDGIEVEEQEAADREALPRPDASLSEVRVMLGDEGVVTFTDPGLIEARYSAEKR